MRCNRLLLCGLVARVLCGMLKLACRLFRRYSSSQECNSFDTCCTQSVADVI